MPVSSKKISRLEKEAILRSKDSEYKREQAAHLLTNSYQDEESFENERHRRYDIIRQTHQIQREIDHQVGFIDKLKDRKQEDILRKQTAIARSVIASLGPAPPKPASSSSASSLSTTSSKETNRVRRSKEIAEKYASKKQTSDDKLH